MEKLPFLLPLGFGLYILWRAGMPDALTLLGETEQRVARFVGHFQELDGLTLHYAFEYEGKEHQVTNVMPTSKIPELGTEVILSFPKGRPELARKKEPVARAFFYAVTFAFLAVGIGGLAGWIGV